VARTKMVFKKTLLFINFHKEIRPPLKGPLIKDLILALGERGADNDKPRRQPRPLWQVS